MFVAEDPKRPGLLYVGTDAGVYASFNRGECLAVAVRRSADHAGDGSRRPSARGRAGDRGPHGRSCSCSTIRPVQALNDTRCRRRTCTCSTCAQSALTWQPGREVPPAAAGRALLHVG